jgi:hypothetical protein
MATWPGPLVPTTNATPVSHDFFAMWPRSRCLFRRITHASVKGGGKKKVKEEVSVMFPAKCGRVGKEWVGAGSKRHKNWVGRGRAGQRGAGNRTMSGGDRELRREGKRQELRNGFGGIDCRARMHSTLELAKHHNTSTRHASAVQPQPLASLAYYDSVVTCQCCVSRSHPTQLCTSWHHSSLHPLPRFFFFWLFWEREVYFLDILFKFGTGTYFFEIYKSYNWSFF